MRHRLPSVLALTELVCIREHDHKLVVLRTRIIISEILKSWFKLDAPPLHPLIRGLKSYVSRVARRRPCTLNELSERLPRNMKAFWNSCDVKESPTSEAVLRFEASNSRREGPGLGVDSRG
jgi:hypothetical protein